MRTALFLAPIILLAVVLRLPAFFQPAWYGDEGIFAAVAHGMTNGSALYSEIWDNKPPGIFVVYGAAYLTGLEMLAVRLIDMATMAGVVLLVFLMGRRLAGEVAALVAAAVCAVLLATPVFEGHLANTESFMVLFTGLGMYLLLNATTSGAEGLGRFVVPGIALGAAALFKQVAVFDALAGLVFILLVSRCSLRQAGGFVAGLALLPLLAGGYFLLAGSFGDFWYANAGHLPGYRGDPPPLDALALKLLPLAIALPYAVSLRPWQTRSIEALVPLWLAFAILGVAAAGRAYPHYLIQVVPPLSLLLVTWASRGRARVLVRSSAAAGVLAASLLFYHFSFSPLGWVAWNQEPQTSREYYRNFIEYVRGERSGVEYQAFFDRQTPSRLHLIEAVSSLSLDPPVAFVWGDLPWTYPRSGLENPTRYPALFNAHAVEGSNEAVAELLLERQAPHILVLEHAQEDWDVVDELLGEYYEHRLSLEGADLYVLIPGEGDEEPLVSRPYADGTDLVP